jgi:anti-anti-sigma factor
MYLHAASDDGGQEGMSEPQSFRDGQLFEMTERHDRAATVLALAGELDFGTVGQVQVRLAELRERGDATVLDLDGLTFMDSTGIRLVLTACDDSQRNDWSFHVTRGSERVRRVLEAAQVIDRLPYRDLAAG